MSLIKEPRFELPSGDTDEENWGFPPPAMYAHVYDSDLGKLSDIYNFNPKSKNSLFDKIKKFDLNKKDQTAGELVKALAYSGKAKPMSYYAISAHTPGILAPGAERFKLSPPNHAGDQWCESVNDNIIVAGLKVEKVPEQIFDEKSEYQWCKKEGTDKLIFLFDDLPNAILKEFLEKEADKIQGEIFTNMKLSRWSNWTMV